MIPNIQLNETSPVIAILHKMMQLLHSKVDIKERMEQRAGEQTQQGIRKFQKQNQLPVDEKFVVDKPTINFMLERLGQLGYLDSKIRRTVSGKVQMASGQVLHRVPLAAIDLDLPAVSKYKAWETTKELIAARDTIEFLGLTETGQDGHYEISFYDWMYEKSERRSADVVVFALNKGDNKPGEQIIGRSALFQNVGYHTDGVNILIQEAVKESGEYKPLLNTINSYLKENKMDLSNIFGSYEQISFVASELAIDLEKVQLIVQANALAYSVKTKLKPVPLYGLVHANDFGTKTKLEPELLYGLGRQNIALDWESSHRSSVEVLEQAIAQAIEEKDIDTFSKADIDAFIDTLKTVTAIKMLEPGVNEPNIANELLALSLSDQKERVAFTKASNQYTGTDEDEFWETYLPKQTGFKATTIKSLRQNQKLFALSGAHLPLVTAFANKIKELPELVQWDLGKWEKLVKKTGFPAHIKGENEDDKVKNYAIHLRDTVNKEYPNAAIQHKITSNIITVDDAVRTPINQFLNTVQDFDIKRSKIKDFGQSIDAVAGENSVAVTRELKELQRLVRINPDTSLIQALKNKNLTSATAISYIPKKTFVKQNWEEFGSREMAMKIHANALTIDTKVRVAEYGVREYIDPFTPHGIRSAEDTEAMEARIAENWPGYSDVFNVNVCECGHCNSVYGPAAYFVDLMRFLGLGYVELDDNNPQKIFRKRRPDLFHLPLTCENSNTLIPYIDLANEVMENYIFYTEGDPTAEDFKQYESADTGSLTETELRAQAQNIRQETYMTLAQAIFPINLPFHLPLEILHTYSNQLSTSWYEIFKVTNDSDSEANQRNLGATYLHVSEKEYEILTGVNFEGTARSMGLPQIYGFSSASVMAIKLKEVPEFLTRSGLAYTELINLLKTNFINPYLYDFEYLNLLLKNTDFSDLTDVSDSSGANLYTSLNTLSSGDDSTPIPTNLRAVIDANELSEEVFRVWIKEHFEQIKEAITLYQEKSLCDLSTTELRPVRDLYETPLTGITEDTLIRLHTFIRLWRKLDWTMDEVDAIITALGNTAFEPELLKSIAYAKQLIDQTSLSPKQAAILWGSLDYQRPDNLYGQLFLKRFNEVNEVFVPQPGKLLFGNLSAEEQLLSKYTPDIQAAYKVNEDTLLAIYAHALDVATAPLSLDNLSLVYRYILFAKACEISVSELIHYVDICGLTPFENPEKTLEAFTKIKAVKGTEFTLDDLAYILGFEGMDTAELELEEDSILERGKTLQNEYARIDGIKDEELQIEEGRTPEATRLGLKRDFTYQQIGDLLNLTPEITKALVALGDMNTLVETPPFDEAFETLIQTLHKVAATILGFSLTEQEVLYFIVHSEDFSDLDLKNMTVETWWRLLDYISLKEQLPQTEFSLIAIFEQASSEDTLILTDALVQTINDVTQWKTTEIRFLLDEYSTFPDFRNEIILSEMSQIVLLARQMGIAVDTLYSLNIEGTTEEEKFEALWNNARIMKNVVKAKYNEKTWTTVATKLNDKLREKQRDALVAYLLNTKFIKDPPMGITDANGLYEFFLIDVQMSACMDTSRMVQASAAIQQFVNRVHLNLEEGITPDKLDRNRWEWMQHYRVWEAQMRVLYENYTLLNPEWRQDKSPFFDELVSHLTQNDITERTTEEALRGYLKCMNEVANLNVAGSYEEKDKDGKFKCLHVFGHTNHTPYTYYYRTWNDVGKWSAWEKVDAAIQPVVSTEDGGKPGVHLIPVVWKNRLLLFWPEFMEKTAKVATDSSKTFKTLAEQNTVASQEPIKYWEVRLAWSEYYDNKWTAKEVSDSYIRPYEYHEYGSKKPYQISFSSQISDSDELFIYMEEISGITIERSGEAWYFKLRPRFQIADISNGIGVSAFYSSPRLVPVHIREKNHIEDYNNNYIQSKYKYNFEKTNEVKDTFTFGYSYLRNEVEHQLLFPNQLQYDTHPLTYPFFYAANDKTYFVKQAYVRGSEEFPVELLNRLQEEYGFLFGALGAALIAELALDFNTFHHPFVSDFISNLNRNGIGTHNTDMPGLMESDTLINTTNGWLYDDGGTTFEDIFNPNFPLVFKPSDLTDPESKRTYFKETIDFDPLGANSKYNWELFFHAPLHIATELSKNGKHKEAIQWFHYIFDPTTDEVATVELDGVSRFWKVKPFKTTPADEFEVFIKEMTENISGEEDYRIKEWRNNPFNPHLVASNFPVNYMKYTVLMYVQNLVDWGDSLFRRFTRENVYEAIQLYVIASHILGPKPSFVPKRGTVKTETFDTIKDKLGNLNARAELENSLIYSSAENDLDGDPSSSLLGSGLTSYFCIPPNEKLMHYWEIVEDRLFKIRNCKDINGISRRLALFAPRIDPAALIKAKSAGLDLSTILDNLYATPSHYRFGYLLQKANEFCSDVKGLGNALISAIEKQDGEALSRLRSTQEIDMLNMIQGVKERQVLDAQMVTKQLLKQRETAIYRFGYYNVTLLGNEPVTIAPLNELDSDLNVDSQIGINPALAQVEANVNVSLVEGNEEGVKIIPKEKEDLKKRKAAMILSHISGSTKFAASIAALFPTVGTKGQPLGVGVEAGWGGQNMAMGLQFISEATQIASTSLSQMAGMASTTASYIRREQEWANQANLIAKEIEQLERQILSAGIRVQVAEKDLENHKKQIENANRIESYLKYKFTSKEFYGWMKDQLSSLHKQSYDLAFEMAKKAEMAFEFEKGPFEDQNIINYTYCDNSRYCLNAGEKLQLALRNLEVAYQEENTRQFELTKHISLKQLNPIELIRLRETGKCSMRLYEELFDLDYPGHFNRRIKSVSLSIPCVVGPYTSIPCTLRLGTNQVRTTADLDAELKERNIPVAAIATSSAQNDSGVYELNFRDERYVPFEGAGAISDWGIELFHEVDGDFGKALRQFDYSTISDVIMHVRYTAEENGTLKEAALANLKTYFANVTDSPSFKIFDLKHDFPSEWHRFLHPANPDDGNTMEMKLSSNHFPYRDQMHGLQVNSITVLAKSTNDGASGYGLSLLTAEASDPIPVGLSPTPPLYGDLYYVEINTSTNNLEVDFIDEINWQLRNTSADLLPENEIEDIYLILNYAWA